MSAPITPGADAPADRRDVRAARDGLTRAEATLAPEARTTLSPADRRRVVEVLTVLVEELYVHLPLKRAMHGIDPVQQLRRLHQRTARLDDDGFHRAVDEVLLGLRDAHTTYAAPPTTRGTVARLPVLVEAMGPVDAPRFLVSKVAENPSLAHRSGAPFTTGVEVTMWNGVPMDVAVRRHAEREPGGRPDSGLARALDTMTFRPLRLGPPPDEHWVDLGYEADDGRPGTVRLEWRFVDPGRAPDEAAPTTAAALATAVHPERAVVRRAKKLTFNDGLWRTEHEDRREGAVDGDPAQDWIAGRFRDNVSARTVRVGDREVGHLRIWSFALADDVGFVDEVVDLLGRLPQDGLVVDVRGNPGGLIWAAERLLQLFTPHHVEPTRFSLLATDLTRDLAAARHNRRLLGPWQRSLLDAVGTGELYSQAVPITPVARCNDIGQVYGGPVVVAVDATTYSAADLFAAGMADNGIGTIVAVGDATGAGGANVWDTDVLRAVLADTRHALPPLPDGVQITLATRRATRVGPSDGAPIEDVGVAGHRRVAMTRDDLLHGNVDFLAWCARLLDGEPRTAMAVRWDAPTLHVTTTGLDRVDVHADGRPIMSLDVARTGPGDDPAEVHLDVDRPAAVLRVEGWRGATLAQVRRVDGD